MNLRSLFSSPCKTFALLLLGHCLFSPEAVISLAAARQGRQADMGCGFVMWWQMGAESHRNGLNRRKTHVKLVAIS